MSTIRAGAKRGSSRSHMARTIAAEENVYSVEERIGRQIEPHPNGCWLWTGAMTGGYGMVYDGKPIKAHRWVYSVLVGPIDSDTVLHHECRVTRCVNPAHLTPTTQREHSALHRAEERKAS